MGRVKLPFFPNRVALKGRKAEFHAYQPKSKRKYKVTLRNIHQSMDDEEISHELEAYGHQVCKHVT